MVVVSCGSPPAHNLTLASLHYLLSADVVVHDGLIPPDVLSIPPPTSLLVPVPKKRGLNTGSQSSINEILVKYANQGKRVVRLKGGDASIFGRLEDEVTHLREAGVEETVWSGVTTASAVAAKLGFSLTGKGGEVKLVTGHGGHLGAEEAQGKTWVIYMGLREMDKVLIQLKEKEGVHENTACVAVQDLGGQTENVVWGRVSDLVEKVKAEDLKSPVVVVVGDVVAQARDWSD